MSDQKFSRRRKRRPSKKQRDKARLRVARPRPPFLRLPNELLVSIFQYCDTMETATNLRLSCRELNNIYVTHKPIIGDSIAARLLEELQQLDELGDAMCRHGWNPWVWTFPLHNDIDLSCYAAKILSVCPFKDHFLAEARAFAPRAESGPGTLIAYEGLSRLRYDELAEIRGIPQDEYCHCIFLAQYGRAVLHTWRAQIWWLTYGDICFTGSIGDYIRFLARPPEHSNRALIYSRILDYTIVTQALSGPRLLSVFGFSVEGGFPGFYKRQTRRQMKLWYQRDRPDHSHVTFKLWREALHKTLDVISADMTSVESIHELDSQMISFLRALLQASKSKRDFIL